MMINKVLFNRLEADQNLTSIREGYKIDELDWNFIRSLYFIARRLRHENLFFEKNYRTSAERVIPRLLNLLQWTFDQETLNRNNITYRKLLKASGSH